MSGSEQSHHGGSALDRVAVALDTSDWSLFSEWCGLFGPRVGALKVGLEAFSRWGTRAVREARSRGRAVFLDLKLHDIPSTVAHAVAAVRDFGADYLTLHISGGPAMLEAAREAAGDDLRLLGVTLLTHLEGDDLEALALHGETRWRVELWADLAYDVGLAGVVCSPLEAAVLRVAHPRPFLLVTPGIRWAPAEAADDQRRTAGPAEALAGGADLLVVGRPLTRATDPEAALEELLQAIAPR